MIFHQNIIELAGQNENFRQVLKTGRHSQVVLMSLLPGEDIGNEVHETVDQILIFVEGNGTAEFNRSESDLSDTAPEPVERVDFKAGDLVFVDAGTWHNFTNTGSNPLKLYTIYSPANHPADRIQKNKPAVDDD